MKDKTKELVKKVLNFIFNPRLLLCFGIAWIITNGWSYIFAALGPFLGLEWMTVAGLAYMGFLWLPFTPEKLLTIAIAIFLLKIIFPKDEKTLLVLSEQYSNLKETVKKNWKSMKEKKNKNKK